jgi:hypothetical protein
MMVTNGSDQAGVVCGSGVQGAELPPTRLLSWGPCCDSWRHQKVVPLGLLQSQSYCGDLPVSHGFEWE